MSYWTMKDVKWITLFLLFITGWVLSLYSNEWFGLITVGIGSYALGKCWFNDQ